MVSTDRSILVGAINIQLGRGNVRYGLNIALDLMLLSSFIRQKRDTA